MPQSCSVWGCKTVLKRNSGISFHCFPKEEKMRQLWLNSMKFGQLKFARKPRVCSKHFKKEDFVFGGNVVKLNKYAVPSRPVPSRTVPKTENLPNTSSSKMENTSTVEETEPAICKLEVVKEEFMPCTNDDVFLEEEDIKTDIVTTPTKVTVPNMSTNSLETTRLSELPNCCSAWGFVCDTP